MTRTIGVALLGLGNVGGGVVKLLEDNSAAIQARLGAAFEIRAIVVRDPAKQDRVIEIDRTRLTTDLEGVVKRADIDVVCELIGGTTLAKRAVLDAIAADTKNVLVDRPKGCGTVIRGDQRTCCSASSPLKMELEHALRALLA